MAGGPRGRTNPGTEPDLLSSGPSDAPIAPVSGPAVATATAAGVLGLAAGVISVLTLRSDGEGLHAWIVALLFVPAAVLGVVAVTMHRRFVAHHMARLRAELTRRADAQRDLSDELERRGEEIAELTRSRQLLLAQDDLLRERMQESFVNLSMRSLTLVERQLDLIEKLEHSEEDARRLDELFRLDHLATRMRRNSENVLILANADERHGHRPAGTLLDVVRAAVSEIEYYDRVDIGHIPRAELAGHTADDLSHLIAELLENAAAYSPPSTRVTVAGRTLENRGVLLTVEDEGFGVPPDRLPELNGQLQGGRAAASATDLAGLGVFVVGALAVRHGLRVQLRPRREGGLAAIVMLPAALLNASGPPPTEVIPARDGAPDGRHEPAAPPLRNGPSARTPGAARSTLAERHAAVPRAKGTDGTGATPVDVPAARSVEESAAASAAGRESGSRTADDAVAPTPPARLGAAAAGLPPLPKRTKVVRADGDAGARTASASGSGVARGAASGAVSGPASGPGAAAGSAAERGSAAEAVADVRQDTSLSAPLPKRRVPGSVTSESSTPEAALGTSATGSSATGSSTAGSSTASVSSGGAPAATPVTGAGLPKRVPRGRPSPEAVPAAGSSTPTASSTSASPSASSDSVRDSGPIAAEELRRRLSGFQMGSTAARQAADDEGAPPLGRSAPARGGEPR